VCSRRRIGPLTEVQSQVLRVTVMFRFERGGWKIIHRHADMMVDLQLP
jgi:ketosteroid isomerase-like protein